MKLIVLGTRGFPKVQGGVEAHCENLYVQLAKLKCRVTVLGRKPYIGRNTFNYKGVELVPIPCPRSKYFEAFLHTLFGVFAAKKKGCDLLHIHAVGPGIFVPLARLLGLKVVMTNHGPDYQREKWGKSAKVIIKMGERLGTRWANAIICISPMIAESVKTKYKRTAYFIPNGVNIPEVLKSESTLEKYGLSKGRYILSVGRFCPEKGFHDLIESFNLLRNSDFWFSNRDLKLVIVGKADHPGEYSLNLERKSKENPNIKLTGFLTGQPLQELYSHAGVFVLPSYYEGMPIVLLEALSYGLSCIASDIPSVQEMGLLPGNRYFRTADIKQISQKIIEFVDRPLKEDERTVQLNKLREKFSWEKIADKTLELYKKTLSN